MKLTIKQTIRSFMAMCALFLCVNIYATSSPSALLENLTTQMISALKSSPKNVSSHIRSILLPHVDVDSMSRAVLGRQVWDSASQAQQQQFKAEFQRLVIRTYSTALAEYDDQIVTYYPIRGGYQGKKFVQVNSMIKQKSGSPIKVNYRLVLQGSAWKVYDFSVDGISMVQSYRSQFSPIANSKGMEGVLAKLRSHNRS